MDEKPMVISGQSAPHKGNGRKFGYPTANIPCSPDLDEGVFVGFTTVKFSKLKYDTKPSIIFIGNPTTLGETDKRLETHIFDIPDEDLYGAEFTVEIKEKLRDNQKFGSIDALVRQMHKDEEAARSYFAGQDNG